MAQLTGPLDSHRRGQLDSEQLVSIARARCRVTLTADASEVNCPECGDKQIVLAHRIIEVTIEKPDNSF